MPMEGIVLLVPPAFASLSVVRSFALLFNAAISYAECPLLGTEVNVSVKFFQHSSGKGSRTWLVLFGQSQSLGHLHP